MDLLFVISLMLSVILGISLPPLKSNTTASGIFLFFYQSKESVTKKEGYVSCKNYDFEQDIQFYVYIILPHTYCINPLHSILARKERGKWGGRKRER